MRQRVVTAIVLGIIVLALLFGHNLSRLALLAIIPILAVIEYLRITKASWMEYLLCALLVILICFLLYREYLNPVHLVFLCVLVDVLLIINLFTTKAFITHRKSRLLLALLYIISPFILAIFMEWHVIAVFIISTMLLIWSSDSGAYLVGSRIGKNKLFPKISPGKTWEGFLGGGLLTVIIGYAIFSITNEGNLQFWLVFALICWIMGSLGDLVASHVKRIFDVKDSGTILPGHGGFFDRFDSIIFVIPFLLLLISYYR